MKKTLFLLSSFALAAASAQAAVLCTTTFNRTGGSLDTVTVNTQSEYGLTSSTSISNFNKGGSRPAVKEIYWDRVPFRPRW